MNNEKGFWHIRWPWPSSFMKQVFLCVVDFFWFAWFASQPQTLNASYANLVCLGVDMLYKDTISRCTILNDLKIGCTICFEASITKTGNLARGKILSKIYWAINQKIVCLSIEKWVNFRKKTLCYLLHLQNDMSREEKSNDT